MIAILAQPSDKSGMLMDLIYRVILWSQLPFSDWKWRTRAAQTQTVVDLSLICRTKFVGHFTAVPHSDDAST